MLEALAPDSIAMAVAALDALGADTQVLERQWALKRERAAFETERSRRQYDAVEPENRLVARSLEAIWEERLRAAERVEQDYERWKAEQAGVFDDADRARITALGADLPGLWQKAAMADRKALLRLVISEVVLDQSRIAGSTWIRIMWQTGAHSEHSVVRNTAAYTHHAQADRIEARIRALNGEGHMDAEIADALNCEGLTNTRGKPFDHGTVHLLRQRWNVPTVKINGTGFNPPRWPDGSYSVQGAAATLGITAQTVFKWLRKGRLGGRQLAKGQPWKIILTDEQIGRLQASVRRTSASIKEAS